MNVTENTKDRLVIEFRPWLAGAVLIALILVMVLLGMRLWATETKASLAVFLVAAAMAGGFVIFIRRILVTFDAESDTVTIRTARLTGQAEQTLRLSHVQHAFVETSIDRSRSSHGEPARRRNTHRPVLQMPNERVPLNTMYTGGRGAFNAVDAINTWLGALRKKAMPMADLAMPGQT
jgi:hypothetical protein